MGLRYHLSDVHGLQKAIWAIDEKRIDALEDLETQLDASTEVRREKRKLNTVKENGEEHRPQKKGRCFILSPSHRAEVEGLHIIP